MTAVWRLGVLTSGGDCAGLNAAICAIVYRAIRQYGWSVFGIKDGSLGLMNRPLEYQELTLDILNGTMLRMGGTMLGTTNKGDPFAFPQPDGSVRDLSPEFVEGYRMLGLNALIVIGGDGSLKILKKLCASGNIPMVAIPKTIDNDVHQTEFAIGFTTAANVVVEALDRLQPTAASHHRAMILEVMGREAGHIALNAGIAGGADVILIPEISYSLQGIAAKIADVRREGRSHVLIVVAEGCMTEDGQPVTQVLDGQQRRYGSIGQYLAAQVNDRAGLETRVTVLGHVQRGGQPCMRDRLLASAFGVHAVDLAAAGRFGRMVAWQNHGVVDVPIAKVVGGSRRVDPAGAIVHAARSLGIYVGEA